MGKYERRYKQILLSEEMLDRMIGLPGETRVIDMSLDPRRRVLRLLLENPDFEPVPEGTEAPIQIVSARYYKAEDGGKRMEIVFPWEEGK